MHQLSEKVKTRNLMSCAATDLGARGCHARGPTLAAAMPLLTALVLGGCMQATSPASDANFTARDKQRLGPLPNYVEGGARNPMGARSLYLYAGGKDTLYRIHGTNQPAWIGHAISSGCIRLTNEDVIDLYRRVKVGATVVVLGPRQGASRLASAGSSRSN